MVESGLGRLRIQHTLMKVCLMFGLVIHTEFSIPATAAYEPGAVYPNKSTSSPSHIRAMKKFSVWLHWEYVYIGNSGSIAVYIEQIIGYNSTSQPAIKPLARRTNWNGVMGAVSPIPAPFQGRAALIPSNSTLVIHDLKYNDSNYQFSSFVIMGYGSPGSPRLKQNINLKPVVHINVEGSPELTSPLPASIEVNEGSVLEFVVEMDGNPKPSVEFQWPHTGSSATNVASKQIYPYIYSAKYMLSNVAASYCGRILTTRVKNSIGSLPVKSTNVTVMLNLDGNRGLQAGKVAKDNCVEVKWQKKEFGACFVKYQVKFKTISGNVVYTNIGYNIGEMNQCSIPKNVNITNVELIMSFKSTSKVFNASVSESPIPTMAPPTVPPTTSTQNPDTRTPRSTKTNHLLSSSPTSRSRVSTLSTVKVAPPKDSGKQSGPDVGVIVGATFGGVIFLILVILLVLYCVKRSKENSKDNDSREPDYPLQEGRQENQYAMANDSAGKRDPYEPTYADPKGPNVVYGKLGAGGGRKGPRPPKPENVSDYADVKLDENGYPAVGAMPVSYSDGYGQSSWSRGERDSGRRMEPDRPPPERRPPPPYNDSSHDNDEYPVPRDPSVLYAQVNKPRKQR